MSATELERLRDRVEQLEAILGINESLVTRLRKAFTIQPGSAQVLGMLLNRQLVTKEAIYSTLYGLLPECDQPVWKSVDIVIHKLRRALKPHGVVFETLIEAGYTMKPEIKARVRAILAEAEKQIIVNEATAKVGREILDEFPTIAIKRVA